MNGRRIEIVERDGRPDLNLCLPTEPGDYVGPIYGYNGDRVAVYYLLPNAHDDDAPESERRVHHVTSPPHTFHEEDDGSLTIRASILSPGGWHGYLTRGEWTRV